MQLLTIDKPKYRKHLNIFIAIFVVSFALLAVLYGTLLIAMFSDGQGDNFKLNLAGVVLGLITCTFIINKIKDNQWFTEIYYVWQLKQLHNSIYRSLNKIKAAAEKGDAKAITILWFYYHTQKQVYLLDDNDLTINKVNLDLANIEQQAAQHADNISLADFDKSLIDQFK